ncbi:unnamed protein product, partial [Mesorhabditis belari]|uniref:Ceramidase n=1 Tax=Mesorhabditis belari TaxID=2138241 RepID=A0AAF3J7Z2_9BILA
MRVEVIAFALFAVALSSKVQPPPAPFNPECRVNDPTAWDDAELGKVPWFNVDLDAPPHERYQEIAQVYKDKIPPVLGVLQSMVQMIFGDAPVFEMIEGWFRDAYEGGRYPAPYSDEIQGIADVVGIPVEQIAMMNVFYELSRWCTSIVAESSDNSMWHARNLDFGQLFIWDPEIETWDLTDTLRQVTVNINFMKGGKLLYKGTTFAGHTGIITGMRMGEFTLSMNAKEVSDYGLLMEWLTGDLKDTNFAMWVERQVMENATTFEEARTYLSNVQQMSNCYYILGGKELGTIIIRNATSVEQELKLHDGNNDWYLLMTNYDPQQDPLWVDDRRTGGNACMKELGKDGVSLQGLYKVLKSKTTLNKTTAHTVVMSITHGVYEAFLQQCPNPCWPF